MTALATSTFPSITNPPIMTPDVLPSAVLTTTFTPPAGCLNNYYQLDGAQTQEWLAPFSIDSIVASSCYASEWVQHNTAEPFAYLICPEGYQTQRAWPSPAFMGYRACCPSGYQGLTLRSDAPNSRPASGATCWSSLELTGVLVTYYLNGTALSTSTQTPIGPSHHVFAHAYDGMWVTFSLSTASNGRVISYVDTSTPTTGFGAPVQTERITGSVNVPAIIPSTTLGRSTGGAGSVQCGRAGFGTIAIVARIAACAVLWR